VAVIMDSFQWLYSMETSHDDINVNVKDLKHFQRIWKHYDPAGSGRIHTRNLKELVEALGSPIGREHASLVFLRALRAEVAAIPGSSTGMVTFKELFLVLTTRLLGVDALVQSEEGDVESSIERARKVGARHAAFSAELDQEKVAKQLAKRGSVVAGMEAAVEGADGQDLVKKLKQQMCLQEDATQRQEKEEQEQANSWKPPQNLSFRERVRLLMEKERHAAAVKDACVALDLASTSGDANAVEEAEARLAKAKVDQAAGKPLGSKKRSGVMSVLSEVMKKKQTADEQQVRQRANARAFMRGEQPGEDWQDRLAKLESLVQAQAVQLQQQAALLDNRSGDAGTGVRQHARRGSDSLQWIDDAERIVDESG